MENNTNSSVPINAVVSHNLKMLREHYHISMKGVAEALGVKPNTYRVWENPTGKNGVRPYYLLQLAKIFGVSVDFLLTNTADELPQKDAALLTAACNNGERPAPYGDSYITELSDYEKIHIMQVRRLSAADRKKADEFIGALLDAMDKMNSEE